jgi:hypothetical protein
MGAKNSYADGVAYGRKVALGMSSDRRRDNDRHVAGSGYVAVSSPTRAFWLGFRRAMRGQA